MKARKTLPSWRGEFDSDSPPSKTSEAAPLNPSSRAGKPREPSRPSSISVAGSTCTRSTSCVIEGLIKVGAFDSMGAKRAQLTAIMELTLDEASAIQRERALGQTSLFGTVETDDSNSDALTRPLPRDRRMAGRAQILQFERELTGFYITAHPLTQHAEAIRLLSTHTTTTLHEAHEGREIKICGVIGSVKVTTTQKREPDGVRPIGRLAGFGRSHRVSRTVFKTVRSF